MSAARPSIRAARLAVPAAAAALLLLAGCAGADGGGGRSYEDSPLSQYMSAAWGGDDRSPEEMQSEFDDQNRQIEEFVADCMAEEGFDYVPVLDNGSVVYSSDDDENAWDPDSRDWVAQYGYGFVNYPGRDDQPVDTGEEWTDPNQEYVESLSESEQTAYFEALHGPTLSEEEYAEQEESGEFEYDWTTAGCYGAASNEIYGEDPSSADEHQPLLDAMSALYEEAQAHPDMVELDAAWSSCMADAGHSGFSTQQDAQNSIMDEQNAFYENQEPSEDGEWVEPDFTELGELEIEVALADFDCRDEVGYSDQQLDVQFELEERFIEEHKAELDAYLASIEND